MFAQRSPVIIIQNVVGAIIGFVGLFFVLRYIGTTDWGYVAFGMGFVGIFSLVGDLGYSTAHTIKISTGEDIARCNGTYLTMKLILGTVFALLVVTALEVWVHVLHRGFQSPIEYWITLSLIPYYFFSNITAFSSTYFKATLKSVRTSIPPLVEAILRNSIFVFIALVITTTRGRSGYYDALFLSSVYSVTFGIAFVISLVLGRPWKIARPTRALLRSYTLLALPLMVVTSISTVNGSIDKVLIQFFWQATATGAFYTSQTIAAIITTLSGSMTVFFVPLLIRYQKYHGKKAHNESIYEFERLTSLYLLPLVVAMSILAPYVMNIFTARYISFSLMLSLLSWRAYLAAINAPYQSAIVSRSKTGVIAKIDFTLIVMNIILMLVLVPPSVFGYRRISLGAYGAAYAMLIVGIVSTVVYRIVVFRMEHLSANLRIFRQAVPAFVQGVFIILLTFFIVPKEILLLAGVTLASILLYLGVAILMRETSLGEIFRIISNFNPVAIRRRFADENDESDQQIMDFRTE